MYLFTKQSKVLTKELCKASANSVGKRENVGKPLFLVFPHHIFFTSIVP